MSEGPQNNSAGKSPAGAPRDHVSLVVVLGLVALGAGGIASVFAGPLLALVAR